MPFMRRSREDEPAAADVASGASAGGAAALRDELGLAPLWYFEMRYKEELARAARGAVIFSIASWTPRVLATEEVDPEIMRRAAKLITGKLRNYDVAARIDEGRYVALLLDADNHHASTVAYRIKADIQVQIPGAGKWRAGTATFGRDSVEGDALIQVALRRLQEDAAAA
jgi:hypothetical protein